MFIFLHHCLHLYPGGGTMAVAFFFVLGGFSMTLGYRNRIISKEFSYKEYLSRRVTKFYPLHWICLVLAIPFTLGIFKWTHVPVFILNAGLLHTLLPLEKLIFSYNAVSWYLADTMFFAVVFPIILKGIVAASLKGKGLIAFLMTIVYVVVAMLIPKEMYHAVLYASPYMRLMDFVLGIYLALVYLKLKEHQSFKWNNAVSQIVVFSLIALLVVESCLLSETATLFAPVYWIPMALLIFIASLSDRIGGGKIFYKTNICYALAS